MSTQMRHILILYQEKYNGLSATAFRRRLAAEHEISIPDNELRAGLRQAGLSPRPDAGGVRDVSVDPLSRPGPPRDARMIAKILVALDGSPRASGVFDTAAEVARRFSAVLHLFRVIFVPPEFPAAAAGSRRDRLPEHLSKEATDELVRFANRTPHLAVQAPIVRVGQPWRLIVEVADELDVDLIVIGSHGYHGLDRILGTTAARVANYAHRSVLVVHERTDRAIAPPVPPSLPRPSDKPVDPVR